MKAFRKESANVMVCFRALKQTSKICGQCGIDFIAPFAALFSFVPNFSFVFFLYNSFPSFADAAPGNTLIDPSPLACQLFLFSFFLLSFFSLSFFLVFPSFFSFFSFFFLLFSVFFFLLFVPTLGLPSSSTAMMPHLAMNLANSSSVKFSVGRPCT